MPSSDRRPPGQRRGADRHRRHDEQREGIAEPAGQVEERAELADVEEQRQHRLALREAAVLGGEGHRHEVERRRGADDQRAGRVRNADAELASAKTTVVDWPRTASQRSRISVRSRIQALRASTARGGRLVSDMAAG